MPAPKCIHNADEKHDRMSRGSTKRCPRRRPKRRADVPELQSDSGLITLLHEAPHATRRDQNPRSHLVIHAEQHGPHQSIIHPAEDTARVARGCRERRPARAGVGDPERTGASCQHSLTCACIIDHHTIHDASRCRRLRKRKETAPLLAFETFQ